MKKVILKVSLALIVLFTITSCTDTAEEILDNTAIENQEELENVFARRGRASDPGEDGTNSNDDQE